MNDLPGYARAQREWEDREPYSGPEECEDPEAALAASEKRAVPPPEFQEVSWGVDAAMRPIKGLAVSEYAFRQWAADVGITLLPSFRNASGTGGAGQ